jgi:hypothetical protein
MDAGAVDADAGLSWQNVRLATDSDWCRGVRPLVHH